MSYDKAYTNALLRIGIEKGKFPKYLYKYRSLDKRTFEIIINSEFYFSSPLSFNDPFDCNLAYKTDYTKAEISTTYEGFIDRNPSIKMRQLEKNIGYDSHKFYEAYYKENRKMVENSGILSLSKRLHNITMWSHYSDNHKGIVFELDITEDYDFFNLFGEVDYVETYEELSFSKDNKDELLKLFLTKYIDWEYEREIRILDLEKNGKRKFKRKALRSIIFGYKTGFEDIKTIINLCDTNNFRHVKFKKAKLIPGKFALDFEEINKEDYL